MRRYKVGAPILGEPVSVDLCNCELVPVVKKQLGSCVTDVSHWCAARRLQLNCDKTERIEIRSKAAMNKLKPEDHLLTVNNDTTINTKNVVRK